MKKNKIKNKIDKPKDYGKLQNQLIYGRKVNARKKKEKEIKQIIVDQMQPRFSVAQQYLNKEGKIINLIHGPSKTINQIVKDRLGK